MPLLSIEEIQGKAALVSAPLLASEGVELVELEVFRAQGDVVLRFFADRPQGGITIAQCARLNRAIVDAIEADGFLAEGFVLEFSSPGLDRPLRSGNDFRRNINAQARVRLTEPVNGKKEWAGRIIGAGDGQAVLSTKHHQEIIVPLALIEQAVLVI